jgi:hypothetical protein
MHRAREAGKLGLSRPPVRRHGPPTAMKIAMKKVTLPLALFAALAGSAQANLLNNGSFETGAFVGGSYGYPLGMQLFSGNSAITGWTVGGELAWFQTGQGNLTPQQGNQAVDLTGFCDLGFNGPVYCQGAVGAGGYGTISQSVATIAGATYHLGYQGGTYGVSSAAPTLVGQAGATSLSSLLPSGTPATGSWTALGFDFVATSASTLISFGGTGGGYSATYYLGVDNAVLDLVSLPVPEAGRGALMLMGLLVPLALARRRLR